MNKEKGNIDFDQIVRERFANDMMTPPSEMWQEIDNSIAAADASPLESVIVKRFQENTLSPSFLLRQKILLKSSLLKFADTNYLILTVVWVSIALLTISTLTYYALNESKKALQEAKVIQVANKEAIDKNPKDEPTKQMQSAVDSSSKINKLNELNFDQKWFNAFKNNIQANENSDTIRAKRVNDALTKENKHAPKEKQLALPNLFSEEEETQLNGNLKLTPTPNPQNQFDALTSKNESSTRDHFQAQNDYNSDHGTKAVNKLQSNPEPISESVNKEQDNNRGVASEKVDRIKTELNSLIDNFANSKNNASNASQKSKYNTITDSLGKSNRNETVEIFEKDSLPIENMQRELKTENAAIDSTKIDSKNDLIVAAENKSSPFSITALISLIYVDRFLKTDNEGIKDFYNQHQKGEWQVNAELIGNYHINKKWSITLGVSMVNLRQDISLQNLRPEESQTIQMDALNQSITVASSLNEVTMSNLNGFEFGKRFIGRGTPNDLSKAENLYSFNFLEEQEFNFLHLPLSIQYSVGEGKTKFIVSAGLLTSYLIKNKSRIEISTDVNPDQKAIIENYHSVRKVSFGLTTRAGIIYSYSPDVSFLMTPTFNYSISNLNQSNSNKINPFDLRISLGVNYRF